MALTPGTRLGAYEIMSLLGAGGMGEVHKARDTRLDRVVAIKVLSDSLASDAHFRGRFDREARAISALDHPHICTLYDVGQQAGTAYLVMQFLEGETLEHRLRRGALPLDQALQYAIQIADALDKAHRGGIVHRDLKPGNIMLTKNGAVLLDFGLAKSTAPLGATANLSMLPTTPANATAQGTILGTFQYMAPEQLEGRDADVRTDIFAFGEVVYEMLTGRKAFVGKSQASLISAIMSSEPSPVSAVQEVSPPALDHVIGTCLAKEPDQRWQTTADVARQLRWIRSDVSAPSGDRRASSTRRAPLFWLGAFLALLLAAVAGWTLRPAPRAVRTQSRWVLNANPNSLTLITGNDSDLAISPDGSRVVYRGLNGERPPQLLLRPVDRTDAAPIAGTEWGDSPAFSPDGQWVSFYDGLTATIKRAPVAGGPVAVVTRVFNSPAFTGMTWTSNDTIVFATAASGLWRVAAAGGEPRRLTMPEAGASYLWPSALPNGDVLFQTAVESAQLGYLALNSGAITRLSVSGSNPRFSQTGHIVYASAGNLFAVRFDAARKAVVGTPEPVLENVLTKPFGVADFAVAGNGSLVFLRGGVNAGRQLVWVGRHGVEESLGLPPRNYSFPRLSPESTRVAVRIAGDRNVWRADLDRPGTLSRISIERDDNFLMWMPDGKRVVFFARVDRGAGALFSRAADGRGSEERLLTIEGATTISPEGWSPDGRTLVFTYVQPDTGFNIGLVPLDGKSAWKPLLNTKANEDALAISPDGRWIAYEADDTGQYEVYVERFPDLGDRQQISTGGGRSPLWSRSGHELFYRRPIDGAVMGVAVTPGETLKTGTPSVALRGSYITGNGRQYDVSPDGQRFLMIKDAVGTEDGTSAGRIIYVENWADGLK